MEQVTGTSSVPPVDAYERRKKSLIDLLYLLSQVWLFVLSLFYPLVGIVLGIVFMSAASNEDVRRIGRVCLILGIINIVLLMIVGIIALVFGSVLGSLPFAHRWGGI